MPLDSRPVPQQCVAVPVPYTPGESGNAARIVAFLGEMARQGHSAVLNPDECRAVWEHVSACVQDLMRFEGWQE
jgi:hypothetical protein